MGEPMNDTFATFSPTKFPNDIIKKILRRVGLSVSECLLCQFFLWEVVCHQFCSVMKLLKVVVFYQKHIHLFKICIQFFCLTRCNNVKATILSNLYVLFSTCATFWCLVGTILIDCLSLFLFSSESPNSCGSRARMTLVVMHNKAKIDTCANDRYTSM